jgi:hypothetical protein
MVKERARAKERIDRRVVFACIGELLRGSGALVVGIGSWEFAAFHSVPGVQNETAGTVFAV